MDAEPPTNDVLSRTTTYRLDTLPAGNIREILKYVLPFDRLVVPRYKCGMLLHGARSECLNDDGASKHENIDAAILQVSRTMYNIGTMMIYGENKFYFTDAEICKWWLRTIGSKNLRCLRQIILILNSGWFMDEVRRDGVPLSPVDISYEETWFRALCCLQKNTELAAIIISTHKWDALRWSYKYNPDERHELCRWREAILERLGKFRGIKKVNIEHTCMPYLTHKELHLLRMVMMQPPCSLPRIGSAPKVSLSKMIDECRRRREQWEQRQHI